MGYKATTPLERAVCEIRDWNGIGRLGAKGPDIVIAAHRAAFANHLIMKYGLAGVVSVPGLIGLGFASAQVRAEQDKQFWAGRRGDLVLSCVQFWRLSERDTTMVGLMADAEVEQ